MRVREAVGSALVVAALAAGCTSSKPGNPAAAKPTDPPAAKFAAGTCAQAADAVLHVGKLARSVRDGQAKPAAIEPDLTTDQQRLRTLPAPSGGELGRRLAQLTASIGFFRISLDSHTYSSARLTDVLDAQHAVVTFCTQ